MTDPQAVLFDMDGTLVDTESLWWQATEKVSAGLGHALSTADKPEVVGRPVDHTAAHLHRVTAARCPRSDISSALHQEFAALVTGRTEPRPGVIALLDLLNEASIPLAVVSASPREIVDAVLESLGPDRFATSVAAGETARAKPAPDPYLAAARQLGVPPADCVAVEDSPVGLASAEAAGCRVLAIPSLVPIDPAPGRLIRDSLCGVDLELLRSIRC